MRFVINFFYPIFVIIRMKNFSTPVTSFLFEGKPAVIAKGISILLITFFINCISFAQSALIIEGTSPKLYIVHKVTPRENFYSVGRMYNASPKDIAAFNNLQFENGLNIGELIKIPLSENNFSQSEPAGSGEVLVPVYHSVQPKESLYRLSINYNKVPIGSIKKWNHLSSDDVSVGTALVIGYLKVSKEESPLASKGVKPDMDVASVTTQETKPEPVKPDITPEALPPVKNPEVSKEEKKDVQEINEPPKTTVATVNTKSNINFSGGYFKKLYNDQTENKAPVTANGNAATFKSTSGWQDRKYYCFNNDASPGAIIKVTYFSTGKSIYAKVLDAIPDIKQNSGVSIIVSNAAAEELGAEEDKFICGLSYVK